MADRVWYCSFERTIEAQPRIPRPEDTTEEGYEPVFCGPSKRCGDGCGWFLIERDPEDKGGPQPQNA